MYRYILASLLASIVGIIGGIQGNAGTIYLLAGLLFFNIVKTQQEAAAITLLYTSVPLTLGAAWEFHKRGKLDYKIAAVCIKFGFTFSILGARLNFLISELVLCKSAIQKSSSTATKTTSLMSKSFRIVR